MGVSAQAAVDENGFRAKIRCDEADVMNGYVTERKNEIATGLKASTDTYNMEIYANKKTGSWTLVGVNKTPKEKYDSVCVLNSGNANLPYKSEKFYAIFFKNAGKPAAKK